MTTISTTAPVSAAAADCAGDADYYAELAAISRKMAGPATKDLNQRIAHRSAAARYYAARAALTAAHRDYPPAPGDADDSVAAAFLDIDAALSHAAQFADMLVAAGEPMNADAVQAAYDYGDRQRESLLATAAGDHDTARAKRHAAHACWMRAQERYEELTGLVLNPGWFVRR